MQNKHHHHIIPRAYLSGFECPEKPSWIWVYERGKNHNPGYMKSKYNPRQLPIKTKAGVAKDFYAAPNGQGGIDFNSNENILEKQEFPSNSIFEKLRNSQMITLTEKMVLSEYMAMLIRRVPKALVRQEEKWPELIKSTDIFTNILKQIDDAIQNTDVNDAKKILNLLFAREVACKRWEECKSEIPRDISRALMVRESILIADNLSQMTWQFLVAPSDHLFITSDNPIFFFSELGIKGHPSSEVSFPISKNIALAASWDKRVLEGLFHANSQSVEEINRRTARNAHSEVYCSKPLRCVTEILNKRNHQVSLIFG